MKESWLIIDDFVAPLLELKDMAEKDGRLVWLANGKGRKEKKRQNGDRREDVRHG